MAQTSEHAASNLTHRGRLTEEEREVAMWVFGVAVLPALARRRPLLLSLPLRSADRSMSERLKIS